MTRFRPDAGKFSLLLVGPGWCPFNVRASKDARGAFDAGMDRRHYRFPRGGTAEQSLSCSRSKRPHLAAQLQARVPCAGACLTNDRRSEADFGQADLGDRFPAHSRYYGIAESHAFRLPDQKPRQATFDVRMSRKMPIRNRPKWAIISQTGPGACHVRARAR
jgi:hypothetical protein